MDNKDNKEIQKKVPENVKQHRKLLKAQREIKYLKESKDLLEKGIIARDKIIEDLKSILGDTEDNFGSLLELAQEQSEFTKELISMKDQEYTGSYTFLDLIRIQKEEGVSNDRFYEMATDLVCEDPNINKFNLDYDDIYIAVKEFIDKERKRYMNNGKGKDELPSYLKIIK